LAALRHRNTITNRACRGPHIWGTAALRRTRVSRWSGGQV